MPTRNFVPRANGEGSVGTTAKKWGDIQAVAGHIANRDIASDGATLDSHDSAIDTLQTKVTTLEHAYAGAKAAATVADMTDHNQIYVYVGSETGYTNGNWYYWNGTAWVSGGVYQSTALETDKTLTVQNVAADSYNVGANIFPILEDKPNNNITYIAENYSQINLPAMWESGDIYNGRDTNSSSRIRTKKIFKITKPLTIYPDETMRFSIATYDDNGTYIDRSGWETGIQIIQPCNFRLVGAYVEDGTIDAYSINQLFKINNKNYMIEENVNAILKNKSLLKSVLINGDWYNGNISTNFKRAITENIMVYEKDCNILFDGTMYAVEEVKYTEEGEYISRRSSWLTNGLLTIKKNTPFRLVFKKTDDDFITNEDIATLYTSLEIVLEGDLPNYYRTHIAEKSLTINMKSREINNVVQFAFFTDLHITANSRFSPDIINEVCEKTGCSLAICGGDIPPNSGNLTDLNQVAIEWIEMYNRLHVPTLITHGNHDWQIAESVDGGTDYHIRSTAYMNYHSIGLMKNIEVKGVYGRRYYYYDDSNRKIRYIVLDDFEPLYDHVEWGIRARLTQEQVDWFINEALIVPQDYLVVVISHAPSDENIDSNIPYNVNVLHPVLEAFVAKSTINISYDGGNSNGRVTVNKDFANYKGTLVAHICGHNHKDRSVKTNGVWCISSTSDAHYYDDGISRDVGTVAEQAIDFFIIDPQEKKLSSVRVGGGENRGEWEF